MKIIVFFLVVGGVIAQQAAPPVVSSLSGEASAPVLLSTSLGKENKSRAEELATQAASEKLPQVSASILRTQLQQEKNPEEKQKLILKLGEMLVVEHRPNEALLILDSKDLLPDPMISFWKAQALLASGKAIEAELMFQSLLTTGKSLSKEYLDATNLALARTERALGKNEEALKIVETIPANSSLALPALEERCSILLALKRNTDVEELLKNNGILVESAASNEKKGISGAQQPSVYGQTRAASNDATQLVAPAIEANSNQQLSQQPRLLYLYALAAWQRGDQTEALRRFTMKKTPFSKGWTSAATVAGIADCQTALQKPEEAQTLLEKYLQENPKSSRLPELMEQLEDLYAAQKNKDVTIFYKWTNDATQPYRASYAMLPLARMLQQQGHLGKSDMLYHSFLSKFPSHPLAGQAYLELAQEKLNQGDPATALSLLNDQPSLTSVVRARMAFLRGLAESALKHLERAEQEFHQAELIDPSFAADAQYNQMLLRFVSNPTKEQIVSSPQQQKIFNEAVDGIERKEYLLVLNSDHGDQASASVVIKKARAFLAEHPHSSFANEVRMKLGEALLKKGLVRDARVELENVGHAESTSELGRQAFLLAAQAAAHSMDPKSVDDAIMILEQVAQNNKGSYDAWQARLEQAALKNAQALPLEAIAIDDQILTGADVPSEIRYTAQMAKGDTLSGLGAKDPNNYQAAINTWRALADIPAIPPRWRNQALCKIGLIEEKLGENDMALATYYEAIKTPRLQEPEQLWHDKAAFEAGRLLEGRHQWNEAIQLYQQIVAEGGPRAAEAKARISKLRLENFLWE